MINECLECNIKIKNWKKYPQELSYGNQRTCDFWHAKKGFFILIASSSKNLEKLLTSLGLCLFVWAKWLIRCVPDLKTPWDWIIGRQYFNKIQTDKYCKAILQTQRLAMPALSKGLGEQCVCVYFLYRGSDNCLKCKGGFCVVVCMVINRKTSGI